MGTALTEHQLRELKRLTQRLFLCFDSDAAGEDATLRGMELAVRRDLRCAWSRFRTARIRLTTRPASRSGSGRPSRRRASRPPRARSRTGQAARVPARPGHLERDPRVARAARRVAARERPSRADGTTARGRECRDRRRGVAEADRRGERLEREALAGCVAHADLIPVLAEMSAGPFRQRAAPSTTHPSRRRRRGGGRPRSADRRARRASRRGGNRRGDRQGTAAPAARTSPPPGAGRRRSGADERDPGAVGEGPRGGPGPRLTDATIRDR